MRVGLLCGLQVILYFLPLHAYAQLPLNIPFVPGDGIGVDGPWPYISLPIGDLTQNVSLFPGSGRPSLVINASACSIDNSPKCPSKVTNALLSEPSPGVFDKGGAAVGYDPEFAYLMNLTGSGLTTLRTFGFHVESDYTGSRPVPDTMTHVSSSYVVNYPGGPQHSWTLDVGVLSHYSAGGMYSIDSANGSKFSGYQMLNNTFNNGLITRSQFAMHLGSSSSIRIPPSMTFGGYDSARLLADYVQTNNADTFDLLDIGIGVSSGASPLANVTTTAPAAGLLKVNDTGVGPQKVGIDGRYPYIYLPTSTCRAIAAYLPVSFNEDLALYIWNVTHPAYRDIITSPSYLSFTFNQGVDDNQNATIKVPFALLNLTLTPPLVSEPTPYFPCRPLDLGNGVPVKSYFLGRAFLQQAFYAIDFSALTNWLGQAPGPNIPSGEIQGSPTGEDASFLYPFQRSSMSWERTWSGHLKPLDSTPSYLGGSAPNTTNPGTSVSSSPSTPSDTATSNSSVPTPSPGLSAGGKAGAGVGAAIGALTLVVLALAAVRYYRNKKIAKRLRIDSGPPDWERKELDGVPKEKEIIELQANNLQQDRVELRGETDREIDDWRNRPELPGDAVTTPFKVKRKKVPTRRIDPK